MTTAVAERTITQEEARAEIMRRARRVADEDTLSWVELNRPCIKTASGEVTPFVPYPWQRDVIRDLDRGGPMIACKARQIGFSTAVMMQRARRAICKPNLTVLVLSRKERLAKELIDMARLAWATATDPGKPRVVTNNALEFSLSNGSRFVGESAAPDSARSYTATDAVFDEFALCAWQREMYNSVKPAVEKAGSSIVVISTPQGEGDVFHELWVRATGGEDPMWSDEDRRAGYAGAKVGRIAQGRWGAWMLPWWADPGRDEEWARAERQDWTSADWQQEYECSFAVAGAAVFGQEHVRACADRWREGRTGQMILGVDVAGEGRDNTVLTMLSVEGGSYRVISQWATERIEAPDLAAKIGRDAQAVGARIAIDATGLGWGVAGSVSGDVYPITFTGGSEPHQDGNAWRVPRSRLLENAILVVERGALAIPPSEDALLTAMRTARWEKRQGTYVDHLDSLLCALWIAERGQREVVEVIGIEDVYPDFEPAELLGAGRL